MILSSIEFLFATPILCPTLDDAARKIYGSPEKSMTDPLSSVRGGYDRWALVYDHDANPLPALEETLVRAAIWRLTRKEIWSSARFYVPMLCRCDNPNTLFLHGTRQSMAVRNVRLNAYVEHATPPQSRLTTPSRKGTKQRPKKCFHAA